MDTTLSNSIWNRFKKTFLGDKVFYRVVLTLALPIIAQNTISNLVNLLDNVMIGSVGTAQLSGVAIANQLIFVFNLTIFGAVSGAGIYGAQFAGAADWEGLRQTFRFKLLAALGITAIGVSVLSFAAEPLIGLYLTGKGSASEAAAMLGFSRQYLRIMVWSLLPFALTQSYSGTLRETGNALLPMVASITAVLVNLVFNYLLIFGKFGFPQLGVRGAAIATLFSRFVEFAVVSIRAHSKKDRYFFLQGVYRSFRIRMKLAAAITSKSLPLLANELLWSLGMITIAQIYSTRGLQVVAGLNIASTFTNLFNVFIMSMGAAVAVLVGQALGANDIPRAKSTAWKIIFFCVCVCVVLASILALCAGVIPRIYNTSGEVRYLATVFMRTSALYMSFNAIAACCYFTIRSGGKMLITFLFDCGYSWAVAIPFTYAMVHFTGLGIGLLYPICFLTDVMKSLIGVVVVRAGRWARNMVSNEDVPATDPIEEA